MMKVAFYLMFTHSARAPAFRLQNVIEPEAS